MSTERQPQPFNPADQQRQVPEQFTPKEKQPTVKLVGRAGRDAVRYTTAKGVEIAKFPLATHVKDEDTGKVETTWHTIVTFGDRALETVETVKKGETYRVVGYEHERPNKDGEPIKEIYAAVVKPPSKKSDPEHKNAPESSTEPTRDPSFNPEFV